MRPTKSTLQIEPQPIGDWQQLQQQFAGFQGKQWFFRGQSETGMPLATTLERARRQWGLEWTELLDRERGLVRHFHRHYHNFSPGPAPEWNYVELLALMQHHGAGTRLLDWTYSFYAACYFALEESGPDCPAAVWAVCSDELRNALERGFPGLSAQAEPEVMRTSDEFYEVFGGERHFICALSPYRLNRRIGIQQGVFLCPGNIAVPFEDNLSALLGNRPPDTVLRKFEILGDAMGRRLIMEQLHRMNVNAATLYPGLEGFARSMRGWLALPKQWLWPDRLSAETDR